MNEQEAKVIAEALGGEAWQSGGGIWLVIVRKPNGRLVVVSADAVCEYPHEIDFESGRAAVTIHFT